MVMLQRILIFSFLLMVAGCQDSGDRQDGQSMQSATLALNWYPEMEHGGFLAAEVGGEFAKNGVKVQIVPGGPGAPQVVIAELQAGRIEFAVSDADNVVKARAAGVPVVALLAPLQDSPRCIMVHKASGFSRLEDLKDIELAISESRPFALWMKKKLPLTGVTMVPFNGSVGEFLVKPAYAQQGYIFSEPFVAKEKGGDPEVLLVSTIGFNPYASLLVTTEAVIREKPELVRSVVLASVAGWKRYLADPKQTNDFIGTLNSELSPEALQFGATAMAPLCQTPEGQGFCEMNVERWRTLISQIEEVGDIPAGTVKAEECFTHEFFGGK